MNIKYLIRNVKNSMTVTKNIFHAIRYLILNYEKYFKFLFGINPSIKISYKFPEPLGEIHLLQRFNRGADNYIFSEVFIDKCYSVDISPQPKTILDLGANVGYSSIFFKKKYPAAHVVCVEPIQDNLVVLHQNIKINRMEIEVLEGAISSAKGTLNMEKGTKDYNFRVTNSKKNDNMIVKALTVEEVLNKFGWDFIDLLKVDIEGSEKELFATNADWLYKVNNLIIEAHYPIYLEEDIIQLVKKYNFFDYKITHGLFFIRRKNNLPQKA